MFFRRFSKGVAVFMLLVFVNSVVAPTVSYALTAGPTAPEATSFEPVDTTDMVDLKTGDFTYNVPLLEVPGPAGGYPLSLAYHAGIQPDQEASWTGLGFVLNPGSISRIVNGYPDDHNNVTSTDRSFWEGGETTTHTVGISVGIANVANVTAGMSFAHDTYRGRGVGGYVGAGISYKGVGLNGTVGISPYGDSYSSIGLSLGVSQGSSEGLHASASIGVSLNSQGKVSAGIQGGIGVGPGSLLGASLSSNSPNVSLSIGGGTAGVFNSKANKISTTSDNFQVDIPVYYALSIRLGRDYTRYWIDEKEHVHTFGSLYLGNVKSNYVSAFDAYDILDTDIDIADHNDSEKVLGGSFPDVDMYSVMGQGISGNIRPYHFQKHLYRQDKRDEADGFKVLSKSYPLSQDGSVKPVEFRFINDFSNRLEYTPPNMTVTSNGLSFEFDGAITTGKDGTDGYQDNHLAGSKHVEWYTNQEIMRANPDVDAYAEGFIDCVAEGFERRSDLQLGGFSITNASGVTYHYALPAYSYDEYMKSVNSSTKQDKDGMSFNELKKPERYAYTWYLTAVTGPDYIDRNNNGLADKGDWGYWVEFSYKKWLSDYKWRNPGVGVNRDLDGDFEFFSSGKKELYYLDKIVTETHVAVFEKSERFDGREVKNTTTGGFEPVRRLVSSGKESCLSGCERFCNEGECSQPSYNNCVEQCNGMPSDVYEYDAPRPSLKLDRIKLYSQESYTKGNLSDEHLLRAIDFVYDYSLAPGTPNSYDLSKSENPLGKLTLRSLKFGGKKGVSLIPPMTFDYKNAPYGHDKTDVWGFYKSDFSEAFRDQTNEVIARETTNTSALDVDAWSLTRVGTSLGAYMNIDYESDHYVDVALAKQQVFRTHQVSDAGNGKLKLTFWEQGLALGNYFEVGQKINVDLIGSFNAMKPSGRDCDCSVSAILAYSPRLFSSEVTVDEVGSAGGYIIVSNAAYYNHLKNETKQIPLLVYGADDCGPVVTCMYTYSGENAWPDYFPAGTVSMAEKPRFGGGLRVKSIGMENVSGDSRTTFYEYEGGTTSFEPFEILPPKILPEYMEIVQPKATRLFYKKSILKKLYKQIGISRQMPAPGVIYKQVTVRERTKTLDGVEHTLPNYTRYAFEVFQEGMVDVVNDVPVVQQATQGSYDNVNFSRVLHNRKVVKDYSSRVGNLKGITLYSSVDNKPVSQTTNHYLHDGLDGSFASNISSYEPDLATKFGNQGVIEETFSRARIMFYKQYDKIPYRAPSDQYSVFIRDERNLLASISKMESYPSVTTGQTNINYKTGVTSTSTNVAFDFYSGEPTQIINTDSYGNRYLSETVPAYLKYPGMGQKVYDNTNKNMLTQVAGNYSFLLDKDGARKGLLSASVQTWRTDVPMLNGSVTPFVWRMHSAYLWNGQADLNADGTYPYADFAAHEFDWSASEQGAQWEKTSEFTLYDVYSHSLEAKDINGNYASTRMNPDQHRVIASTLNSAYTESAYSGAEYYAGNTLPEGGIDRGTGTPSKAHAHTGDYSLLVAYGNKGFGYGLNKLNADLTRKYRASVWVYAPGNAETQSELNKLDLYYTVGGQDKQVVHPILQKSKSKSWYLLNIDITPGTSEDVYVGVRNNSSRGVYFDDFRVHPLDASMTSYVYDRVSGELAFTLDANNFYTKFEYDAMGRLVRTSKELLNFDFGDGKESYRADAILQEVKYNYGKND